MANKSTPAVAPTAVAENKDILDVGGTVSKLGNAIQELLDKKKAYQEMERQVNEELQKIRNLLPSDEDEDEGEGEVKPRQQRQRRTRVSRGGKTIIDYAYEVLHAAGEKGITRADAAAKAIKNGYQTVSDEKTFNNSFYISGIQKLKADGLVEAFRQDGVRESLYRLTAKGVKQGAARKK